MKKLAKISAFLLTIVIIATGCKKLPEFTDGKTTTVSPTVAINVYTQRVTGIGDTKAYFEGFIDNTEISGLTVTVGFCWNTTGNPTLNDNHITTELYENFHFSCTAYGLVQNTTYYVKAWAIIGTENPDSAIYGNEESFTTQGSGGGEAPTGAINGLFSVSDTKQVYFSQGNLQYQASTNIWRFAENQWDFVGYENSNLSSTYNGWIDLFGWGTSGYDNGAVCYQPWSTSMNNSDYYAYGNYQYNLYDQTGCADWGYNAISNGGNIENYWRTLSTNEWMWLFSRDTPSGIRYAFANVNGINGLMIFPDDWDSNISYINDVNNPQASFSTNILTINDWQFLENHSVVFLPVGGYRLNDQLQWMEDEGQYWASNYDTEDYSGCYVFKNSAMYGGYDYRNVGKTVRLVHDAN